MNGRLAVMMTVALVACGGDGDGGFSGDVTARCSLVGEAYDAYSGASGARCGSGDGAGYCNEGDLCKSADVCELVSTPTRDGWCAVLEATYTAFSAADGVRCGDGDGSGYCNAGDRCKAAGICEAVLSSANGQPHQGLFGAKYDAFSAADGARCGSGDGSGYCFAGDRCETAGTCVLVLKGLGGSVRSELIGSQYTASSSGDGVRCGSGEGSGYCKAGDRCVTPGTCEIVLSAWTP